MHFPQAKKSTLKPPLYKFKENFTEACISKYKATSGENGLVLFVDDKWTPPTAGFTQLVNEKKLKNHKPDVQKIFKDLKAARKRYMARHVVFGVIVLSVGVGLYLRYGPKFIM